MIIIFIKTRITVVWKMTPVVKAQNEIKTKEVKNGPKNDPGRNASTIAKSYFNLFASGKSECELE